MAKKERNKNLLKERKKELERKKERKKRLFFRGDLRIFALYHLFRFRNLESF